MNTNNENDIVVLNQNGETTEVLAPATFGEGLSFVNPSDFPDLDNAEIGFNIQPESLEFTNPGDSVRAVFVGFTEFKVKDKVNKGQYIPKKTAVLQTRNGIKTNMGANLIKQLEMIPAGNSVQITYKGEQRTNSGNDVKVYEIHLLNVERINMPAPAAIAVKSEPKTEPKTQYKNMQAKDDYWRMVNQVRLTNEEGNAHLAEYENDFQRALEALEPGFLK